MLVGGLDVLGHEMVDTEETWESVQPKIETTFAESVGQFVRHR